MDEKKQKFISRLSAFRNPMDYDALSIFNDFDSEEKFNSFLLELVDRGMLFRDEKSNKFDLHPIMRKYCYDRLKNKESIHLVLTDYFAYIPVSEKIESLDDLAPVIELYHHTVRAGRYDEAFELFRDRLSYPLFFRFGASQRIIEFLRVLFPNGEDKLPRLKDESAQAWTLNELANSYLLSGQFRWAVPLFEGYINISKNRRDKINEAIGLLNLTEGQIQIGELDVAESNLKRSIEINHEIKEELHEAIGHWELGRLLAHRGNFEESKKEFSIAMKRFVKGEKKN